MSADANTLAQEVNATVAGGSRRALNGAEERLVAK
jgi:hypothetical protein